MSGKRFQARAKTVQKLGRDGLVEQNKATGEEKRVSRRPADLSFGPERPQVQTAGGAPSAPKRRRQPRPVPDSGPPAAMDTANVPERPGAVPLSMTAAEPVPVAASELPYSIHSVEAPPPEQPECTGENGDVLQESPQRQAGRRREPPPSFPDIQSKTRKRRTAAHAPTDPVPPEPTDTGRSSAPPDCTAEKKQPGGGRLHFEPEQTPPGTRNTDTPPHCRQQRRYKQAERRAVQSARKLEKAQNQVPVQRRVHLERQYDSAAGKVRRRLRFEQEPRQTAAGPALLPQAGRPVQAAAVGKIHSKLREAERQNTAVEAAHKGELLAEQGGGRLLHWQKNRRRAAPFRALRHAERQAANANWNLAWQTALQEHPELQRKKRLAKWLQKQKRKRRYAQAARETQTRTRRARQASAAGKAVRAAAEWISGHKTVFLAAALAVLVVLCFVTGMASCTAMLSGVQAPLISAVYPANEADICDADLYYSELETDLQLDIGQTEANHPGYDEYRYRVGEIGHNPYELMGWLSAAFDAFTFEQVQPELDRLFGKQYALTRETVVETRYDSDGNPYDWRVLQTTLTVRPLADIIGETLPSGEAADRYGVYLQTLGGRQAYGNPFDFPWLACVSSGYGWRVHPVTGEKNLHRGVDIAAAHGTPIRAIQDGRVVSAGEAGSYGLCVVIEDGKGYQSRYAHCASLAVRSGQEIRRGDVIATVGSTGQSTGPHLHLEVMRNGDYLNPYYFVDTGDDGTGGGAIPGAPGGPVIPDYPGEPPTDETFAAMLAEAKKYLGFPYVWGGSSPSTSFDCSGYVSWVLNHSGWSVGRLGAQALFNLCTPVSREDARPGDLIFFTKTFSCNTPVSHVGIYVGNGQMIHCGDPIQYADINSSYWTQHFYSFGRMPEP